MYQSLTINYTLNNFLIKFLNQFIKINAGALGVMFEYGIGVDQNIQSAFECLKGAAIRGNVYAQGNLAVHYYRRKLFNKAADVAKRLVVLDCIKPFLIDHFNAFYCVCL